MSTKWIAFFIAFLFVGCEMSPPPKSPAAQKAAAAVKQATPTVSKTVSGDTLKPKVQPASETTEKSSVGMSIDGRIGVKVGGGLMIPLDGEGGMTFGFGD